MSAIELFDNVTMTSSPGSQGWVVKLRDNAFGEPSALVSWQVVAPNGAILPDNYRTLIPLRKLEGLPTDE